MSGSFVCGNGNCRKTFGACAYTPLYMYMYMGPELLSEIEYIFMLALEGLSLA